MMLFIRSNMPRHVRPLQYALLIFSASCATSSPEPPAGGSRRVLPEVRPGIEVLTAGDMAALRGLKVGLITNHTGRTRSGESTIDALHRDPRVELVALFSPEHGIRGAVEGGIHIDNERDSKTGLPIHSLYGQTQKPTAEMLRGLDALVFDIQEIGARFYTYQWTMANALQAAGENGKRFIVLDRPNPIGGELVQGNVNDTTSFVGLYPVAMRHGMTNGELARFLNQEYSMNADLVVIPMKGWTRKLWYEDTGLPWIAPSPNMPSIESATHYAGFCIFEGTNLSVGRGTATAFQVIGAPWLDARALVERLAQYRFPGVRYEVTTFTPNKPGDNKFNGQLVNAVRFVTTDRATYDPTRVALAALLEVRALHAREFGWTATFPRLYGLRGARDRIEAGATFEQLVKEWDAPLAAFKTKRAQYLLY